MSQTKPFRHALPVSETMFHEALYLTHAGWEIVKPGETYPQSDIPMFYFNWEDGRTLPEFCLAQVIDGTGEIQTRLYRGRLEAGNVFLFYPGEWHRHRPSPRTGWTLRWIHFNGDEPHRWLQERSFHLDRNLAIIECYVLFQAQFENLLESVHRSPSTNSANLSRQAIGLLAHILADKTEETAQGTTITSDKTVKAAVEHIWNFCHCDLNVADLARLVGTPRRTLDRRFLAETGHTVLQEIQLCRLRRATQLLIETNLPMKQIVHRAGFNSMEQMRISFLKNQGVSPGKVRLASKNGLLAEIIA